MDSAVTTYASLFAGGGGLDLGFRRAMPDARCVLYVENDAEACALLVDHMEAELLHAAPLWTDALTLDCEPWRGRVDWLIGGPPCQPFSVAGKRLAADDPRNLWPATLRMVDGIQPEGCWFENVPSADSLWYVYEEVIPGLRYLGYTVAAGIFSAAEVGAPHQRERLFILAVCAGARWAGATGSRDAGAGWTAQRPERGGAELGDADKPGLEGRWRPFGERGYQLPAWPPGPTDTDAWAAVLRERPDLAPAVADAKNGKSRQVGIAPRFSDAYSITAESTLRGVVDELPGRVAGLPRVARLRILGNAVVAATAARAFSTLWRELA